MKTKNEVTSCLADHNRLKFFSTDSFECCSCGRIFNVQQMMDQLVQVQSLVDNQSNDKGLWFNPSTQGERNLQRGLTKLHVEIEEYEL